MMGIINKVITNGMIIAGIAVLAISAVPVIAQETTAEVVDIAVDSAMIDTAQLAAAEEVADTADTVDTAAADTTLAEEPRVPRPALFLGITDPSGQPAQSELEQAIRGVFAVDRTFELIGKLETERIIREKSRLGRGGLDNFVPEHFNLSDTTVIIRGIVEDFGMELKRRRLLWSRIDARMTVKFLFLNRQGLPEHQAEFTAAARKNKEFVFFLPPKKVIHISALDREWILKELRNDLVKQIAESAQQHFNPPPPEPEEAPVDENLSSGSDGNESSSNGENESPGDDQNESPVIDENESPESE